MLRRPSSSTRLRLETLEDRCNPSVFDPVAGTLTAPPSGAAAQVDYFLKLKGLDGDVTDNQINVGVAVALTAPPSGDAAAAGGHRSEIELLDWSWGETNAGTHGVGGGGGAGKVQLQDMHFIAK
jgi:hypothetical protein